MSNCPLLALNISENKILISLDIMFLQIMGSPVSSSYKSKTTHLIPQFSLEMKDLEDIVKEVVRAAGEGALGEAVGAPLAIKAEASDHGCSSSLFFSIIEPLPSISNDIAYDLFESRCFCSYILSYLPEASMIGTWGDKSP